MATPKIILYKHKTYSDGTHPIMLQVVKNGKAIRRVISKCLEKDWLPSKSRVSSKHLESPRINNEIEKALRNYGLSGNYTLRSLWLEQIENFKTKQQVSRYEINALVLRQLLEFAPNVLFEDVTEQFIYKFVAHLSKFNSPGTIKEKMNVFGAIIKLAKKRKLINENSFEDLKFAKVKSTKSKLTLSEMQLLINAKLDGKIDEARDLFVTCIYLRGIRVGDALTLRTKNIIDGRLHFIELKTGRRQNVNIAPELNEIFQKWNGKNKLGYIFSFLDAQQGKDEFIFKAGMKSAVTRVNRLIKRVAASVGIEKSISSHTARHSFSKLANEVISNTNITKDLIGHATLSVHEGYISDISDDVVMDGYAKQVLDRLKD